MDKSQKIDIISNLLRNYLTDLGCKDANVVNIYHKKIDSDFCTKYSVDAPLATYGKHGPHLFINVNRKIGFGVLLDTLSFNKNLYEVGKYWSELLNPDFIILFSNELNDTEFSSFLFERNKEILLSGFKPKLCDDTLKKIPIFIVQISNNFTHVDFKYYPVEFSEFIQKKIDDLAEKQLSDLDVISLNDCYIFGNIYPEIEKFKAQNKIRLVFNNKVCSGETIQDARLKLKFFNNVRDLERKLKNQYKNASFNIDLGNSVGLVIPELSLDIEFKKKQLKTLFDKLNFANIENKPPLFLKSFLKGFFDRHFFYLSSDLYLGKGAIPIKAIDKNIIKLLKKLNISPVKDKLNLDASYFEVRRDPFIKENVLELIKI